MSLKNIELINSDKLFENSNPLNKLALESPPSRGVSVDYSLKTTSKKTWTPRELELDTQLLKSIATDPDPVLQDRFGRSMWGSPSNRRSMTLTPRRVRENLTRLKIVPDEERNYPDKHDTYEKVVEFLKQTSLKQENPHKYEHTLEFFRIRLDLSSQTQKPEKKIIKRSTSLMSMDTKAWPDILKRRPGKNSISMPNKSRNLPLSTNLRESKKNKITKYQDTDESSIFLNENDFPKSEEILKEDSYRSIQGTKSEKLILSEKRMRSHDSKQHKNIRSNSNLKRSTGRLANSSVDKISHSSVISNQESPTAQSRNYQRGNRRNRLTRVVVDKDEEYVANSPDEREKEAKTIDSSSKKPIAKHSNFQVFREIKQGRTKIENPMVFEADKKSKIVRNKLTLRAKTSGGIGTSSTKTQRNPMNINDNNCKDLGDILPRDWKNEASLQNERHEGLDSQNAKVMQAFDEDDILVEQPRVLSLIQQKESDTLRAFDLLSPSDDDDINPKKNLIKKSDVLVETKNQNFEELTFDYHSLDSDTNNLLTTDLEQLFNDFNGNLNLSEDKNNFLLFPEKQVLKIEGSRAQECPQNTKGYLKPKLNDQAKKIIQTDMKSPKRSQLARRMLHSNPNKKVPLNKVKDASPTIRNSMKKEELYTKSEAIGIYLIHSNAFEGEKLGMIQMKDSNKLLSSEQDKFLNKKMLLKHIEKEKSSMGRNNSNNNTLANHKFLEKQLNVKLLPDLQKPIQHRIKLKKKSMKDNFCDEKLRSEVVATDTSIQKNVFENERIVKNFLSLRKQQELISKQREEGQYLNSPQQSNIRQKLSKNEAKNLRETFYDKLPAKENLKADLIVNYNITKSPQVTKELELLDNSHHNSAPNKINIDAIAGEFEKIKPKIATCRINNPKQAIIQQLQKIISPKRNLENIKATEYLNNSNSALKNEVNRLGEISTQKANINKEAKNEPVQSVVRKFSKKDNGDKDESCGDHNDLKLSMYELKFARQMEDQAARKIQRLWRKKLGFPKNVKTEDIRQLFKLLRECGARTENFQYQTLPGTLNHPHDFIKNMVESSNYDLGNHLAKLYLSFKAGSEHYFAK